MLLIHLSPFMTKRIQSVMLVCLLLAAGVLGQQTKSQKPPILPHVFAGWEMTNSQSGIDPAVVDPSSGKVLKEYGFTDFETATYTNGDRKMTVKAARFQDATGAYGAFTFYRTPNMRPESIGALAASNNEKVLFFRENVLVLAQLDRVTAMSAGELRELAANLPAPGGVAANLPALPSYFPKKELEPNTAKFIVGPEALAMSGASIDASLLDFSKQPQIMTGKYDVDGNSADFMLIEYPTPQIAGERLRAIEAANATPGAFVAKRSGVLVALVKGPVPERDAKNLLGRVNYEADVTWNENAGNSKRDNIGNLVIAASLLAGVIFLISVVTGGLFGFGRLLMQRFFPERYAAHEHKVEIIRLHLED